MSSQGQFDGASSEALYRKTALETVTSEALFNSDDYEYSLLRGRSDPWVNFDVSSPVLGSVTALHFTDDPKATVTEFNRPDSLRAYFAIDHKKSASSLRRLFVLEGLDARLVEVLGSQLRVPPGVFIAHSTDPGSVDIMDADGFLHDPVQYWIVQVQQLHYMSDGFYDNPGVYFNDKVKPKRLAGRFTRRSPPTSFTSHLVSFWSVCHGEGSWDALIIVDHLYRPTVYKPVGKPELISTEGKTEFTITEDRKFLPRIPRIGTKPLVTDPTTWSGRQTLASESIKDRLIDMYLNHVHMATEHPGSAGWYCQGIIFSMWNSTIHALEERYMALWDTELFAWHHDRNIKWQVEEYQKFSSQQLVARRLKKDYLDVCRKMGVEIDLSSGPSAYASKGRSWRWLLERLNILEDQIGDMMNMSTQRASVEESINSSHQTSSANEQARSVGRLTAFAAVLVPFAIISGIFSMGGEYGVGQPSFWVFWAVAIPVSCATMVGLFCMMSISTILTLWRNIALRHVRTAWDIVRARWGLGPRLPSTEKDFT